MDTLKRQAETGGRPSVQAINPWATRRIYAFINAHRDKYDINSMCDTPGVTRSGCYPRASFKASQGIYGSPRVLLDPSICGRDV